MARMLDGSNWFTVAVSAGRHNVSVDMVRTAIRRGKVQQYKLGGRIWVCDDDVADLGLANRLRRVDDTPKAG